MIKMIVNEPAALKVEVFHFLNINFRTSRLIIDNIDELEIMLIFTLVSEDVVLAGISLLKVSSVYVPSS